MSENNLEPKVSVIIPAYESEHTLERCVNSVLNQSQVPYEILIYDDCSSDATLEIAQKLSSRKSLIKVFSGDTNRGAGYARSVLLKEAKGNFFAFLDADDVWHPEKLQRQMEVIRLQVLDICICPYEIRDTNDKLLGKRSAPARITYGLMHLANWIPTSMAIVRADLIGTRKMPNIRRRQDYAYWLTIFKKNRHIRVGGTNEVLGTYYRSDVSLSSSKITNIKSNFYMFRNILGYNIFLSNLCLGANIIFRLVRK